MEPTSDIELALWTNDRLGILKPDNAWEPNTTERLVQWRNRCVTMASAARKRLWGMAVVVVTCLSILATPAGRILARRALNRSITTFQDFSAARPVHASNLVPEKDRKPAPDFALDDATGKRVSISALKGKVVLLNFWATWCHGCLLEIPWFIDFSKTYKDAGLLIVGVSMDDDGWTSVRPYITEKKVSYSVVIGNKHLTDLYGLPAMPMTLLIDRRSKIAATHVGVVDRSDCQSEIESLLAEPKP